MVSRRSTGPRTSSAACGATWPRTSRSIQSSSRRCWSLSKRSGHLTRSRRCGPSPRSRRTAPAAAADRLAATGVAEPPWRDFLGRSRPTAAALLYEPAFDDGVSVIVEFTEPGGDAHALSVFIDHNLGGAVKDVFLADPIATLTIPEGDRVAIRDLDLGEARARIEDAFEALDLMLDPPVEEGVRSLRALVESRLRLLPDGVELPDPFVESDAGGARRIPVRFPRVTRRRPLARRRGSRVHRPTGDRLRRRLQLRRPAALEPRRGRDLHARLARRQGRRGARVLRARAGRAARLGRLRRPPPRASRKSR